MSIEDFLKYFNQFYICKLHPIDWFSAVISVSHTIFPFKVIVTWHRALRASGRKILDGAQALILLSRQRNPGFWQCRSRSLNGFTTHEAKRTRYPPSASTWCELSVRWHEYVFVLLGLTEHLSRWGLEKSFVVEGRRDLWRRILLFEQR
jgi:hypothetical protein